jgi:hypothetical protein
MARDCKAGAHNEFGFVRFFERAASVRVQTVPPEYLPMFAINRSAAAVLLPLAMLVAVAVWSNRDPGAPQAKHGNGADQAVAANLPSR